MVSIPEKVFQRSYSKEDVFQRDNSPDLAKKRIPKKAVFQRKPYSKKVVTHQQDYAQKDPNPAYK